MVCCFWILLLAKNPKNKKLSHGIPLIEIEAVKEDGPGMQIIFWFCLRKKFINLYPGSEIKGVPASEINAIEWPFFNLSKIISNRFLNWNWTARTQGFFGNSAFSYH